MTPPKPKPPVRSRAPRGGTRRGQHVLERDRAVWELVARQHGVTTRRQLLALGFTSEAIKHRIRTGRLHPLWRGVYAVGRPEVSREKRWMAAVLMTGPHAVLSGMSAAAL